MGSGVSSVKPNEEHEYPDSDSDFDPENDEELLAALEFFRIGVLRLQLQRANTVDACEAGGGGI